MMSRSLKSRRFAVQLVLVFLLFTLGSVILLGFPAAWLLERQTNTQMQALMDQSLLTTSALLENQLIQVNDFAVLLAERPTLNSLVSEGGADEALTPYLADFIGQTDLDAVMICSEGQLLAQAGPTLDPDLCGSLSAAALFDFQNQAWLLSPAALGGTGSGDAEVIVGQQASTLLKGLTTQTGMEYLLLHGADTVVAATLEDQLLSQIMDAFSELPYQKLAAGPGTYLQKQVDLGDLGEYRLFGLLDIDPYLARNRQFRLWILAALAGVSLLGAGVAVVVARGISQPLNKLARSAGALREGDLETPLTTPSQVWEIHQLSNTLEDARVSLKYTLDQLRQEKLWIENLMNAMVESTLTVDDHLRITYVSQPIHKIVGQDPTALLGKHLDEVFYPATGENLFSQQLPDDNQSRRIPVVLQGQESLLAVTTSTILPAESGNATRALMIRDVTDEERVHRLVGEFMANITHEFRTPLSALAASVELLVDELPDLSKAEIGQLVQALNIGVIDLQSLIDNLIEAASIEAGRFKVNPKAVPLSAVLADAEKTMQPLLQKKGLQLHTSKSKPSFLVKADQRRSVQVLVNLLSNAIKHSPDGGTINLRIVLLDDAVLLEIQDEGPGVQPEFQERLFKRFTSPQAAQDISAVGMGLGLSVVKAVVEAQGGRVGFRNHEPGGAVFWFTLPVVPEAPA